MNSSLFNDIFTIICISNFYVDYCIQKLINIFKYLKMFSPQRRSDYRAFELKSFGLSRCY